MAFSKKFILHGAECANFFPFLFAFLPFSMLNSEHLHKKLDKRNKVKKGLPTKTVIFSKAQRTKLSRCISKCALIYFCSSTLSRDTNKHFGARETFYALRRAINCKKANSFRNATSTTIRAPMICISLERERFAYENYIVARGDSMNQLICSTH